MKKILILLFLLFIVSCSEGEELETKKDNNILAQENSEENQIKQVKELLKDNDDIKTSNFTGAINDIKETSSNKVIELKEDTKEEALIETKIKEEVKISNDVNTGDDESEKLDLNTDLEELSQDEISGVKNSSDSEIDELIDIVFKGTE